MLRKDFFLIFICLLSTIACSNRPHQAADQKSPESCILPLPELPEDASDSLKVSIILKNFWDPLDFKDTLVSHNKIFLEQNFANFAFLLSKCKYSTIVNQAVKKLLTRATEDKVVFDNLVELAYLYLYNPDSPMFNEEIFIPFLEFLVTSSNVDPTSQERYQFLLEAASLNRPGQKANNFTYLDKGGNFKSLNTLLLPPDSKLLLIFFDPDCKICKDVILKISDNLEIKEEVNQQKLTVLAIYSGDDKSLWESNKNNFPDEWEIGFDNGSIDEGDLYFFRELPTIYLLNSDKIIMAKDIKFENLIQNLKNKYTNKDNKL